MNILVINSSPMGEASTSRHLTQKLVADFTAQNPGATVVEKDVATNLLPHLDGGILGAFFTPDEHQSDEQKAVAQRSDALIDEVFDADVIVFGIPMHNLGIPSALKSYLDQIMRAGKTFRYTENGPEGLVTGKKAYVVSSRGGDYREGTPGAAYDFINPYMQAVLGFMGITDVTLIGANGTNISEEAKQQAVAEAEKEIELALAA